MILRPYYMVKTLLRSIKNFITSNNHIELINYKLNYEKVMTTKNPTKLENLSQSKFYKDKMDAENKIKLSSLMESIKKLVVTTTTELLEKQELIGFGANGEVVYYSENENHICESNQDILLKLPVNNKTNAVKENKINALNSIYANASEAEKVKVAQKLSQQVFQQGNIYDYNPQTEWHDIKVIGDDGNTVIKSIPVTEL